MTAVRITHVGGPTTLIEVAGWRLLTDPTFDAPGRTYSFGWGSRSTKLAGPAVAAADIGPIDAVLLTHDHHGDNLDAAGRALLPSAGVVVTTVAGAKRLGGGARGLEAWATTRLERTGSPAIDVTATPCRHGPPLQPPDRGRRDRLRAALGRPGARRPLGLGRHRPLRRRARGGRPARRSALALLHLGRVQFTVTGPVHYTLSAREAVELLHARPPAHRRAGALRGLEPLQGGPRRRSSASWPARPSDVRDAVRWVPIGEPADLVA